MGVETHWICPHCTESLEFKRPETASGAAQAQWQLFECEKCQGISLLNMTESDLSPIKVDAHQKKPSLPPAPPRIEMPRLAMPAASPMLTQTEASGITATASAVSIDFNADDGDFNDQSIEPPATSTQVLFADDSTGLPDPLPTQPTKNHWIWKGLPFAVLAAAFYALIGVAQFVTRAVPPKTSNVRAAQHLNEKVTLQNETAIHDALKGKSLEPIQETIEETRSAPATHVRITPEAVTLRAGPSSEYSYLGSMRKGMISEILESKPEAGSLQLWYKINEPASQLTGWVRGDLVELLR